MVVKASTKPWPRQLGSSIVRALPPLGHFRHTMRRVVPIRYILHAMRARGGACLRRADIGTGTRVYSALTPTPPCSRAFKSPSLLGPLSLRHLAAFCPRGVMLRPGPAAPLIAAAAVVAA